jgi:hypothetical protein
MAGEDVWFLTGTDEHGQKVLRTAEANSVAPQAWADKLVADAWMPVLDVIDAANDDFIRTTQERHTKRVQRFLSQLKDAGHIYEGSYEGPYCVGCEEFKLPGDLIDGNGEEQITENGTGLLGNKWMAGRKGNSVTGLPGHIVAGIDGLAYGGFIGTDSSWPDGAQQEDRNEHLIDIGKYISVVGAQGILANVTNPTSYAASCAGLYGGFVASLAPNSAPTNKVISGVRLPFRISVSKLDDLAGLGYVMLQQKTKGIVVSDAPTASRPDSDYQRLSTVRIVKATIDAIRNVSEPFLGEPITGARLAALETAINQALVKLQKLEYLQRFQALVSSTPTQQVQGQADVELILVPAFELRQITVYVSLAAQ